jgi:16S rRNA processing protein RimM
MPQRHILIGVVGRPHGVRGLVRLHSYAAEPADLPGYGPLADDRGRRFVVRWQGDGIAELSQLIDGKRVRVADRAAAGQLVNLRLYVDRDRLPPPDTDEFYLADLNGLLAVAPDGRALGRVAAVHDHGAGVFLEIGTLLIPFTRAAVPDVDLAAGRLVVVPPVEIAGDAKAEAAA